MMTSHSNDIDDDIFDDYDVPHNIEKELKTVVYPVMEEEAFNVPIQYDDDDSIPIPEEEKELVVSCSLIKELMYNGTEIDYCPNYIYHKYLLNEKVMEPSKAMMKGSFGETVLLGGSARGQSTPDLPRKRNGTKTIDQERIESQCLNAENIAKLRNINIIKGVNTQVLLFKKVKLQNGRDEAKEITFRGELDLFPTTFINDDGELEVVIIDIKFTQNIVTPKDFLTGEAMWGNFQEMDDTQGVSYLYLIKDIDWSINTHISTELRKLIEQLTDRKVSFYFWVFDYKRKIEEIENKFFEVKYNPMKEKEFMERIRKTISIFEFHTKMNDWDRKIPCKSCGNCILPCTYKNRIQSK